MPTLEEMSKECSDYCDKLLDEYSPMCEKHCIFTTKEMCEFIDDEDEDTIKEMYERLQTIKVDMVNHPTHYNREGAMETIDEMELIFGTEALMHYCLLNAWKYRARALFKNKEEDLKKSDWYLKKYKSCKEKLYGTETAES